MMFYSLVRIIAISIEECLFTTRLLFWPVCSTSGMFARRLRGSFRLFEPRWLVNPSWLSYLNLCGQPETSNTPSGFYLCVSVSERVGLTVHMDVERSYLFPFCSRSSVTVAHRLSASSVQTLQSAPNSSRQKTAGSVQAPQIFLFRVSPALNIVIRSASARLLSLFITMMYQGQIRF